MHTVHMSSTATRLIVTLPPDDAAQEIIPSRFGDIAVDTRNALMFPRGLLGIPNRSHFVLANFPGASMQQFKLLQSLDERELSFITLPLELDNKYIAREDVLAACNELEIAAGDLALLMVVSVQRTPAQVRISANARAPLFIDAGRKIGAQYVFHNDRYKVQQPL